MKDVIIAGAGAHCKVILDMMMEGGEFRPIGLLDTVSNADVLGVPVIGTDEMLEALYRKRIRYAFVAVGNNRIREKLVRQMEEIGFSLITLISRHAVVSRFAKVDAGTAIMPGAVVNAGAQVGRGCILNTNCSVDHDCQIGDFTHIAPGCAISGSTCIGHGSFMGTGASIIDRLTIGCNVMLGAGAVAINNLPDNCTAVGVPAKIIKIKEES